MNSSVVPSFSDISCKALSLSVLLEKLLNPGSNKAGTVFQNSINSSYFEEVRTKSYALLMFYCILSDILDINIFYLFDMF